jgi:hypothetical protein
LSRETDSSSSGPQGRGGAAYPSGTPPYGTRQYPSLHPQEEQQGTSAGESPAGADERRPKAPVVREPKTETTLTTRVRINIPGSRPIPPVVLRTTVTDSADAATKDTPAPDAPAAPAASEPAGPESTQTQAMPRWTPPGPAGSGAAPGAPAGGAGDKSPTSDWFAPRKPQTGPPTSSPYPVTGDTGASTTQQFPTLGSPLDDGPAGGSPLDGPAPGSPLGGASGTPPLANIPYLSDSATAQHPAPGGSPFPGAPGTAGSPAAGGTDGSGALGGPGADPFGPGGLGGVPGGEQDPGAGPQGEPAHGSVPFSGFHTPAHGARTHLGDTDTPSGPTTGPATGGLRPPAPGTPGAPGAPESRSGYRPARGGTGSPLGAAKGEGQDHVSGATVVSGISTVPAPGPAVPPAAGQQAPAASGRSGGKPARKGRSKPMLAVVGVLSLAVVAYAAGLLMDHADVPNGTVVLGVGIGGDTKAQATKALDEAVGQRSGAPLKLRIGGNAAELKPELAGLSIDTGATVEQVAHRDYNPVSVIGSLFGGTHDVAPVTRTDKEKLGSQLQALGAGTGTGGSDGMVKFVNGTPVAVPGKTYQAVDADAAMGRITQAYELRAQTGQDTTVVLPVTSHRPLVTQAALDQAIKNVGDPAMSGMITVTAGSTSIPFSPQKSLSKILTIVPVPGTGKLTLHIDLQVLQTLYGNAFDGVLLERGNGSKTPVTPQDVASAMLPELSKTASAKTAVIPNVAG